MIGALFKQACLDELQAIKPGNVHVFADGHGMVIDDFIKSAQVSAAAIAQPDISLGQRILQSVQATQAAVHCNTNLGIILLCAPLVQAVHATSQNPHSASLAAQLALALKNTTQTDAELCFKAIALANPAGLGEVAQHDVRKPADCTLQQAMQQAAQRDLIARQYSNYFADIFSLGLPCFEHAMAKWGNASWAASAVYLQFLAEYLDSHIVRKYGENIAKTVQNEAKIHQQAFLLLENPKTYLGELLRWDADLKTRGINPGTCADLTVATLFLYKLLR